MGRDPVRPDDPGTGGQRFNLMCPGARGPCHLAKPPPVDLGQTAVKGWAVPEAHMPTGALRRRGGRSARSPDVRRGATGPVGEGCLRRAGVSQKRLSRGDGLRTLLMALIQVVKMTSQLIDSGC